MTCVILARVTRPSRARSAKSRTTPSRIRPSNLIASAIGRLTRGSFPVLVIAAVVHDGRPRRRGVKLYSTTRLPFAMVSLPSQRSLNPADRKVTATLPVRPS